MTVYHFSSKFIVPFQYACPLTSHYLCRTAVEIMYSQSLGDPQYKLSFAMCLSKSKKEPDRDRSISLFEELLGEGQFLSESYYNLSLLNYQKGDFERAEIYVNEFLILNPDNGQGRKILKAIKYKQNQNIARNEESNWLVAGAVAAGALAAFALTKALSARKR